MTKTILYRIGILLAIILIAWYAISHVRSCNVRKDTIRTDTLRLTDFAGTKEWKDRYNDEHARNESQTLETNSLRHSNLQKDQELKDRAKLLQVKERQIKSMTDLLAEAHITERIIIDTVIITRNGDTIRAEHFAWADKYDTVSGLIQTAQDLHREVDLKITVIAPIKTTVVQKKNVLRSIFGLNKNFVDASCDNKNVKIIGLGHTEINTKKKSTFIRGVATGVILTFVAIAITR